jgi:PAS domain S-box-containing protein
MFMRKTSQSISNPPAGDLKKTAATIADDNLSHLAFDNVAQANIIIVVSTGKVIMANSACCELLGYSKEELLTKKRSEIFDVKESSFKKMLKQRTAEGQSKALVFAINKNGKPISCEITSAIFTGEHGKVKSITTITDIRQRIKDQKNIDKEKEKVVTGNIVIAKSVQKDIDTENKKIVADNITIAKSKQKAIDIKKEKIVADNIVIAKAKQKDIDIKKDKIVSDNILLAKTKQTKIDIKKEKVIAHDILIAQTKSDEKLAGNNEWIKYIAKTSYDVMWDWDLASSQIYVGESMKEVFGYKVKNNRMTFADFCKCLVDEEKDIVLEKLKNVLASGNKVWNDNFRFKRQDESVATTISRASIVRDETGRAIRLIGAIQDVSRIQELEHKLQTEISIQEAQGEKFLLAAKLSFDIIWDWDLDTNEVFIGEGFEELFGYAIKNNKGHMIDNWTNYMHPGDKKVIKKELHDTIMSGATEWEHAYRVIRADGAIAKVYTRASIIRDANGKAYRMIGALQDLSRQNELEEKLDHEISLKEKQIQDATEDAKEMERSNIGKELHDNINQLLGASRMYLEMAKKGGENTTMYLSRSSEYTLNAIEEIRRLTKGLTTDIIKGLGLCIAIDQLAIDMAEVTDVKIACSLQGFNEKSIDDKFKLNIFRIVQEHLNNVLKHANAKKITINLKQDKHAVKLSITDNGIGFDTSKKQKGIGIDNIKSRAASYKGNASFMSKPGSGCTLTVTFPAAA